MLALLPLAAISFQKATWFGPVEATFNVSFAGNPYDPAQNDVHIRFTGPKGDPIDRIAFFDGKGTWKAILVTPVAGKYIASLYRNGKKAFETSQTTLLDAQTPLKMGFVQVDPANKNRFRRDTGEAYYPLGFDLAWQGENVIPIRQQLTKMGANGSNWTRIWACNWDGKNPWWPTDKAILKDPLMLGQLWMPALDTWQDMFQTCEAAGVSFQMTMFHHGAFSSTTDANWPDHPWNAKNGGFLKDAGDFFTDPEAKRRTKMWLRYAVARYAASPNLMAWELFNEVQWVDAVHQNRWADIDAWHKEMAEYIRSIDPYHHLVTTSSETAQAGLFAAMDFWQPHTYPQNVLAAISGFEGPADKPSFFGEFGPSNLDRPDLRQALRDGIYGGMLANQAGAGMFWYWDVVENKNLYNEFANAAAFMSASGLADHPTAKPWKLQVRTAGSADISFGPGGGFEKAGRTNLVLPDDLNAKALAGVPQYLQGSGHRDMFPSPLALNFKASAAGSIKLALGTVAKAGAHVHISVNGKEALAKNYPAAAADHKGDHLSASYPAGSVKIEIFNDGADWATIENISLSNAGPQASGIGMGELDWGVLRLTQASGVAGPVTASVTGLSLVDGDYDVTTIDLISGKSQTDRHAISHFRLEHWPVPSADQILAFKHV